MINNSFDNKIKETTSTLTPSNDFINFTDDLLNSLEDKKYRKNKKRVLPLVASFTLIFVLLSLSPVYASLNSMFDKFKSLNVFNKNNNKDYINTLNTTIKDSNLSFTFNDLVISGDSLILSYKVNSPNKFTSLPGIWDSDLEINNKTLRDPLTTEYGTFTSTDSGYTYDMVSIIDILDIKNLQDEENYKLNYEIKNFDGVSGKWNISLNVPKDKLYDKVYYANTDKALKTEYGDMHFNEISLGQFYTKAKYTVSNDKFPSINYIIRTDKNETLYDYHGSSGLSDGTTIGESYFSPIKEKPNKITLIPFKYSGNMNDGKLIKEIPSSELLNLQKPYSLKIDDKLTINILDVSYKNNVLQIKYRFDGICFNPNLIELRYNDGTYVNEQYGFNPSLRRLDEGTLTYEINNLDDFKLVIKDQDNIIPEYDKQIELTVK
ncbi:DUF4179 domain-containing protein [Clostridium sp. 'White wine YQ']|uniref:DUF4179 domain-containing protein n=1 Tax=Clostridium sp. 'White wine YQ' TaxID=3027474 RepID=UPI002366F10E|nr:DUF4179 domain-containing protein [Clostridium sp. 'White wine YQ']MDD7794537.1 hypothetical protein [Clostridium sp. 'White wine YQ']